jgi:hypothetical protein
VIETYGVVFRTNHSMFEYKVIDTGGNDILYEETPFQNCFVEEILIRNTKNLDTVLPAEFGFFPKAEVNRNGNMLMFRSLSHAGVQPSSCRLSIPTPIQILFRRLRQGTFQLLISPFSRPSTGRKRFSYIGGIS